MTQTKRFISFGALMIVMMMIFVTGCKGEETADQTGNEEHSQETSSTPQDHHTSESDPDDVGSSATDQGNSGNIEEGESNADSTPATDNQENKPKMQLNNVSALRLINDKSGWTGGEGWIARTDNGGESWAVQLKLKSSIKQIFAWNDQEAWAVTDDHDLLHTQNGGEKWIKIGEAPNEDFLHFISPTTGFMGHAITQDGGKTWTELHTPKGMVGEVYYHDKSIGWAVSQLKDDSFQLMKTTDGGKTWKETAAKKTMGPLGGVVIRSMGNQDAWIEVIGGSGMSQTAYSLFHTSDGGQTWRTVIANSTAGGGPAPGYPEDNSDAPKNEGVAPGPLYVVNKNTALMGGFCGPCDKPNTIGRTTDGGATWDNSKQSFDGPLGQLLAMSDDKRGWMITLDHEQPAVLYKTMDGGMNWSKIGEMKAK